MSLRDERQQEREERRARRIQEQRAAEGRERREIRFFRRRERPSPKKKAVSSDTFERTRTEQILSPPMDSGLDPGDPMSQTIWEQAGPLYYTPPEQAPEGTVDPVDQVVTGITRVMWGRAERIRPSTKPLSYEEQRYRMRKRDLPVWSLAMKRAELGALNIGIGAVESFTFPVRPSAWVRTAEGLVGLATDKERRREAVEFAQARPEAVGLQLMGAVFGGYAAGRVIDWGITKWRGPKTKTSLEPTTYRVRTDRRSINVRKPVVGKSPEFRPDLPPKYIKLRGEWFRTGEGLTQGYDPFAIQTVDQIYKLIMPKDKFSMTRARLGSFTSAYTTRTAMLTRYTTKPWTTFSKIGSVSGVIAGARERALLDPRRRSRGRTRQDPRAEQEVARRLEMIRVPRPKPPLQPPLYEPGPPETVTEPKLTQPQITVPIQEPIQIIDPVQTPKLFPPQIPRMSFDPQRPPKEPKPRSPLIWAPRRIHVPYREPEFDFRRRRKKKGGRGDLDLFTFGEFRQYPMKSVEKIMKEMGI